MGLPAVREAGGMTRFFLEPFAVDPAATIAKEFAGATAAGLGAGVANLAVDRDTEAGQWADLLGALGGVGLYSAGSSVASGAGDLMAALSGNPKMASQVVREKVADTIIGNSDVLGSQVDPARPNEPVDTSAIIELLQRPAEAESVIPGFQASTADRAADLSLASLEDARARGPTLGKFGARREANTEAIDAQLNRFAPTEQPGAFTEALGAEREARLAVAQGEYQDAFDALERALAPVTVNSTPTARGNAIRSDLEAARDAARAQTETLYDAADTSGNVVNPVDLARTLDDAMAGLTATERSLIPEAMIDRVRALGRVTVDDAGEQLAPDPVDLREATTLLSEIKRMQRAALADPRAEKGGRNASRVLGQIGDALDDFIAENVTPEQRIALSDARAAKFDEAERFTRQGDPVTSALERYEGGQPKMADERIPGSFLVPDRNLNRLFGEADTPATRAAIRDEMLSRLDASTPEKIAQFQATFREQIARFPGLSDELRDVAGARAGEVAADQGNKYLQRLLGTPDGQIPGRGVVAQYLKYEPVRADSAMQNVLASKSPGGAIDELLGFVGDDPAAVEGARAAFWRVMEKRGRSRNGSFETKSGIDPWMPKKWRDFLDDPATAAVMDRLYRDDPEHLANIRQIAEALRGVNTGNKVGSAINPSGSAQTLRNGPITLAEAQAKFIDVQRGRLNPLYAVTYLAERAYQLLLDEALMNPQTAADLLKQNNPANRAALARRAKTWLGNEASHLSELLTDDDEDGGDRKPLSIVVDGANPITEANDG
jgi:hypothetical protein